MNTRRVLHCLTLSLLACSTYAEEQTQSVELAGGKFTLTAPATWKVTPPRSQMLEHELQVPAPEGAVAAPGRLTIMAAGGSIDANISRWVGQFQATEEEAKVEKETVAGMSVTLFDHAGTYMESMGGPFGPKTPREDYRMLAAIIETGVAGNYFIKLSGPAETLDPAAEPFREMVLGVTKN